MITKLLAYCRKHPTAIYWFDLVVGTAAAGVGVVLMLLDAPTSRWLSALILGFGSQF